MKKLLLVIALILCVPGYFLVNGTISFTSIPMMFSLITGQGIDPPSETVVKQRFKLPDGFNLSVYANDVPNARFMHVTTNDDVLVSRPHKGEVLLIKANTNDLTKSGERIILLKNLNRPSGVTVANGWLFVGESDGIGRIRFDETTGEVSGEFERIIEGLTDNGNHPYKGIAIGPDGKLYLAQGSTCNACIETDVRRATLSRFNLDGSAEEVVATGLRNPMGFDWTTWDDELYATDNGRDLLGDDYPPCELNHIKEQQFYGWPYFNGANQADPDFSKAPAQLAAKAIAPAHEFRAHNAPLGIRFLNTNGWPVAFQKSALVALHGSWNRSSPDGYKLVSLHWQGDKIIRKDFLTGFEKNGNIIGRPVDIAQNSHGVLYVSDDYAGVIYRIGYGEAPSEEVEITQNGVGFELNKPSWLTAENADNYAGKGEELYKKYYCEGCHKAGQGRMKLTTIDQRLQYQQVIDQLTDPRAPMPKYPLSEDDKKSLAVWLMREAKRQQ